MAELAGQAPVDVDPERQRGQPHRPLQDLPGDRRGGDRARHDGALGIFESIARELRVDGYLAENGDGTYMFTNQGEDAIERPAAAWREGLIGELADWHPEDHPELRGVVDRLADRLRDENLQLTSGGA
jgi:hypothetical protein